MILLGLVLVILAGIANAVMDKIQFHWHNSIFANGTEYKEQFWNPAISWKNKYKPGLESYKYEKFRFSTTLLVFLTDAWHLFQMVHTLFLFAGISLIAYFCNSFLELFLYVLLSRILYGLCFELFFKKLLSKKE